jgi:hypothetical protein
VAETIPEMDFQRNIEGAAHSGDVRRIQALLERGAPVNGDGGSGYAPLHYASRNGHLQACRVLLQVWFSSSSSWPFLDRTPRLFFFSLLGEGSIVLRLSFFLSFSLFGRQIALGAFDRSHAAAFVLFFLWRMMDRSPRRFFLVLLLLFVRRSIDRNPGGFLFLLLFFVFKEDSEQDERFCSVVQW